MLTRKRDRTRRSRTSTDECDHDDSDDIEYSHTHASMGGAKVANSENSTPRRSRKIVTVVLTIAENCNDIIVGAADGVDTPLNLQRVIDRCSLSELELKQLYRRAKKGEDMQKQSGYFQCLTD